MTTKIIGLTGGIGSGKTTIANYFASLGVPVYIADDEAKKILYQPETVAAVKSVFGNEVVTDGLPDRKKLAEVVFSNPEKLQLLNAIIHPRVKKHFSDWVQQHNVHPFVIKEAAILFESGSYKDCDAVILVTAPQEIRIKRVMKRDGVTEREVRNRIKYQWTEEQKKELSAYFIDNTEINYAKKQALEIFLNLNEKIS